MKNLCYIKTSILAFSDSKTVAKTPRWLKNTHYDSSCYESKLKTGAGYPAHRPRTSPGIRYPANCNIIIARDQHPQPRPSKDQGRRGWKELRQFVAP